MKKKFLSCLVAGIMACTVFAAVPVSADDSNYGNSSYGNSSYGDSDYGDSDYGKSYKMARVGKITKTMRVKKTFELEVDKKGDALKDNHLKWSIKNKKIVRFVSKDITDDDVKLKALKPGTTKVTCYNKKTGKKIVYTIKVKKRAPGYGDSDYGNSNYGNSSYGNSSYGSDYN